MSVPRGLRVRPSESLLSATLWLATPPIDWEKVKTSDEARKFGDRGPSIVSVMEKEVLSRHLPT